MNRFVYLDHNASAPPRPGVAEAMAEAVRDGGNPSSVHRVGRRARRRIEDARDDIAMLARARADQVVFTSGGSEANNLALKGAGRERILVSAVEHASVLKAVSGAETIRVDADGIVDLAALEDMLTSDRTPALVSVMYANNETGAIQPVAEIAALARAHGALYHCDAVQGAGRVKIDFAGLGADLMTISGHKLGGPQGAGALIVADRVTLNPLVAGGGQERSRRAGTENGPAIAGFGAAASLAAEDLESPENSWLGAIATLRGVLESGIREISPASRVFAARTPRIVNTTCVSLPGVANESQVMALDLDGVMISAGSACSSGKVGPSHVLAAMGVPAGEAEGAIRVSLGWNTTETDIEAFLAAWRRLVERTAKAAPASQTAA
jgi:cysteine desulfurase